MWKPGQIVWINHRRFRVKKIQNCKNHLTVCVYCEIHNPQFSLCNRIDCIHEIAPMCYLKPDPRTPKPDVHSR